MHIPGIKESHSDITYIYSAVGDVDYKFTLHIYSDHYVMMKLKLEPKRVKYNNI